MFKTSSFDILDAATPLQRHYFLEASAGTGKTFTIAHAVIRALCEWELPLEQILVVTFTRAAAKELRERIYQLLKQSVAFLEESGKKEDSTLPPYLPALVDQSEEQQKKALFLLLKALFSFESCPISTIHGFCARILSEQEGSMEQKAAFSRNEWRKRAMELLDPLLRKAHFPVWMIEKSLAAQGYDGEKWVDELFSLAAGRWNLPLGPSFSERQKLLCEKRKRILEQLPCSPEQFRAAFIRCAGQYKNTQTRQGTLLPAIEASLDALLVFLETGKEGEAVFQRGLSSLRCFSAENEKKRCSINREEETAFFSAVELLQRELFALVLATGDPSAIDLQLAHFLRADLKSLSLREGLFSPDLLLEKMAEKVQSPSFVQAICNQYRLVVIDEFQDTDPLQWDLFSTSFLHANAPSLLYLVGDPKQSIYAFRQADIYTYANAKERMGEQFSATLGINYRSHPRLVEAFNRLFSSPSMEEFFFLPKTRSSFPYFPVKPVERKIDREKQTPRVHFFIGEGRRGRGQKWPAEEMEEQLFFPFLVREVERLHREEEIAYGEIALLVKDRYQEQRLHVLFEQQNIPTSHHRSLLIATHPIFHAFVALISATASPLDERWQKAALSTPLIGWKARQIADLAREACLQEEVTRRFLSLKKVWEKEGGYGWFAALMESVWSDSLHPIRIDWFLRDKEAEKALFFLHHLIERAVEQEQRLGLPLSDLAAFFVDLKEKQEKEWEEWRFPVDSSQEGVQLCTLHGSKGLEFRIVFAVGLMQRREERGRFYADREENGSALRPFSSDEQRATLFFEESDAEKARLFYVAITRAKERLYLPVAVDSGDGRVALGSGSAMELFFCQLLHGRQTLQERYADLSALTLSEVMSAIKRLNGSDALFSSLLLERSDIGMPAQEERQFCHPETFHSDCSVVLAPFPLTSFTALAKTILSDEKRVEKGEEAIPTDWQCKEKKWSTLPVGAKTGTLLHQLLEAIDFSWVRSLSCPTALFSWVADYIGEAALFATGWEEVLAQFLFTALKTPLPLDGEAAALCSIEKEERYCELDFLYPQPKQVLKGSIDLFFRYRKKYYLVDWKSNWLGSHCDDYSRDQMQKAIKEHHYDLQEQIYREGVMRYLEQVEKMPFSECFGGSFYLFLRGLNGHCSSGIYLFGV